VLVPLRSNAQGVRRDVVDMLLACHERIRSFTGLAQRLAGAVEPSDDEVRELAARIRRYFVEALPLHVRDEEELIVPRLAGTSAELDAALAVMASEHATHNAACDRLIAICGLLQRWPEQLPEVAPGLAAVAGELATAFAQHLAAEESVIFPAVARLPAGERAAIAAAIQARRGL
jgi:iron-sulfur cluster repair protein YtfE (RIC family)